MTRARLLWWGQVVATAALAASAGCASGGVAGGQQGAQLAGLAETPEALIQMRRNGCAPGRCPVYGVSIFLDGTVTYDGRANVAVLGHRRAKLPPDRLNELITAIEAMDFLDSAEQCCICPDAAPSNFVILDYRPGSVQKTVVHDEACRSAPVAMSALEQAIERATNVRRWTAPAVAGETRAAALVRPAVTASADVGSTGVAGGGDVSMMAVAPAGRLPVATMTPVAEDNAPATHPSEEAPANPNGPPGPAAHPSEESPATPGRTPAATHPGEEAPANPTGPPSPATHPSEEAPTNPNGPPAPATHPSEEALPR